MLGPLPAKRRRHWQVRDVPLRRGFAHQRPRADGPVLVVAASPVLRWLGRLDSARSSRLRSVRLRQLPTSTPHPAGLQRPLAKRRPRFGTPAPSLRCEQPRSGPRSRSTPALHRALPRRVPSSVFVDGLHTTGYVATVRHDSTVARLGRFRDAARVWRRSGEPPAFREATEPSVNLADLHEQLDRWECC